MPRRRPSRAAAVSCAAVALLLVGRAASTQERPPTLAPDDQLRAAVLRHLAGGTLREPVSAICVGNGDANEATDPHPQLLRALATWRPPVLPWMACEQSVRGNTVRATGGTALIIGVRAAAFRGDSAAVTASHHRHGRHAATYACRLHRARGVWRVDDCTPMRRS